MRSFIYKSCHNLLTGLRSLNCRVAHLRPGSSSPPAPSARGFSGDRRGIVAVIVALAMPVLVGSMGLAAEASYWYVHQRGMQNAADAAAIAAATNGTSSGYAAEAQAVAARFGFTNGSGNIKVTATNPNTAAGCTSGCYVVVVSDKVPLFLSKVITGSTGTTALAATSIAHSGPAYPYCILALNGNVATDILSNGGPKANLNGCNLMSDSNATCNGHNLNAGYGDAHGTNNGCGNIQRSNVPTVADPYSYLASNIPADTCGGNYPQEPVKKKDPALPASNQWNGSYTLSGNKIVCGDQQLTGNITINATTNAVLVIENGRLDTNGFTLQIRAQLRPDNRVHRRRQQWDLPALPERRRHFGHRRANHRHMERHGALPGPESGRYFEQSRRNRGRQHANLGPHRHGLSAAFPRHVQRRGQ